MASKNVIPILDDGNFSSSFDPIEANFLSTVLLDCFYQLHNVGTSAEMKTLKLPELFKAEYKSRKKNKLIKMDKKQDPRIRNYLHRLAKNKLPPKPQSESFNEMIDENTRWVQSLVEAHGFLEDLYLQTIHLAKSVIETPIPGSKKSFMKLEDYGLRMSAVELSKSIADHENALNETANERVENILKKVQNVLQETAQELRNNGTFECLKKWNKEEMEILRQGPSMIKKEMNRYENCKKIIHNIIEEKAEGEKMVQQRETQVANLKNYLKEQKVLKNLEISYVKSFSDASLEQNKKKGEKKLQEAKEEKDAILKEIETDKLSHKIMENYLKLKITKLEEDLDFWTKKYEAENELRNQEMRNMHETQNKDHEHYKLLKKRILEYQQVIADEERLLKIKEDKEEKEKLELKNAIRIQAWWRGMRVRRCFGPFSNKKGKKRRGKKK